MDLTAYLLARVVAATTPPGETETDARLRAEAIAAMLRAYDPADGMETMMACQCIMMQFLLDAATRDASNPHQEPAAQTKARAGAISASRTLHQWVTKFENARKHNETRGADAAKTQPAPIQSPPQAIGETKSVVARRPAPPPAAGPTLQAAVSNSRESAAAVHQDTLLAAVLDYVSPKGSDPGSPRPGAPNPAAQTQKVAVDSAA